MIQETSSTAAVRRNRRPHMSIGQGDIATSTNLLAGRPITFNESHHRGKWGSGAMLRKVLLAVCFISVYWMAYNRLDEIERQYDVGHVPQNSKVPHETHFSTTTKTSIRSNNTKSLTDFLTIDTIDNASGLNHPSLEEARKGREHLVSILEDAGINELDAQDVLQLPLWSSVAELYYRNDKSDSLNSDGGPIILGLETCDKFRQSHPPGERFLGVAGNFNSGTTAFGIALQKNCRMADHPAEKNFVMRKRKSVFASNVNGMLSMVPWAKHKHADFRHNHTISPPLAIDHNAVLPIVVVRDPFYWMQSMCKEGYGVRWDHDSSKHCPNLIPNEFDSNRFPKLIKNKPIPVWMGANPTTGPTWPSLIHYWNAWYESYFDKNWPRLLIRFEDTLFYPRQVMEQVCHCGGGTLVSEFDYSLEESKPDHKHQHKNNFVTAMIEYGTNATRLRNMTQQDVDFAIEQLNPGLMKAFGYSYPQMKD